jgi:hypothetical protein
MVRRNRRVDGSVMGNSPVTTRGIAAGVDLGEDGSCRRAPSISDGGVVTGWQTDSCAEMGRRRH